MRQVSQLDLRKEKAPTKSILGTAQKKDGYGVEIDPAKVIPSLTRPVWEPPALEVLDMFESKEWENEMEAWEKSIPDVTVRTGYVDLMMELATIIRYGEWILETGMAAIELGHLKKESYYQGLLDALKTEVREILRDIKSMEREELPDGYMYAQRVVKLHDRLFVLRPEKEESTDTDSYSTDEENSLSDDSRESLEDEVELNVPDTNINIQATEEHATRVVTAHPATTTGMHSLPPFSMRNFAKNFVKGIKQRENDHISTSPPSCSSNGDLKQRDLIDPESPPTDVNTGVDMASIREATGMSKISEVDRLLS